MPVDRAARVSPSTVPGQIKLTVLPVVVLLLTVSMDHEEPAVADDHIPPPVAKRIARDVSVHGDPRMDHYFWMRDRDDPDVVQYLKDENAYTARMLSHTESLQETLFREMVGRIKETDSSVPEQVDGFHYYFRTEEGKQYEIHCRRAGTARAPEEVILDENTLAEGRDYLSVGSLSVSPDHNLLAYTVDSTGSESHTLYIKDLRSGELLDEPITGTYYGVEWANDNRTLFYTVLDEARRPHKLMRHTLGEPVSSDVMIHHEEDDAFFLAISKSRSRKYLVMSLGSNTTTEEWILSADDPNGAFRVVEPRRHEIEYYSAHHGDLLFILTNDGANNFKLVQAPVDDPGRTNWTEVILHRTSVKLDDVDVFENHLVIYEREDGLRRIRVTDLRSGDEHYIAFHEPVYTVWASNNPEFKTNKLRFNYTSLITPRSVIDYDMDAREQEVLKRYEVLGGYQPGYYASERVFATATDGTRIPISLVHRADLELDGTAPLFLYGYGSYGASIEPYFVSNRLSLLDRGFVFAIAHVRGGGEMGRQWYNRGKLLHKRNTFTDFIACAQHLVDRKYTSTGRIVCAGGSAGGLLMGAVANMRPDLWGAVVANVPFVDVVNTMLDDTIPLTVIEYEEWGNPREKKLYEYIRSYSPYDNVAARDYPHMLVTAGLNDPRVQYWEPAKWVACLRARKADNNLLLFRTRMTEGHSGSSGRYDHLKEVAFEYAFVLNCFGIEQ